MSTISTLSNLSENNLECDDMQEIISDPTMIVATINAYLNCCINLELMASNLNVDNIGDVGLDCIIGIYYNNIVKRADNIDNFIKHKKKKKEHKTMDFGNQCTIEYLIFEDDGPKVLNLKIFNNGKIVITGKENKKINDMTMNIKNKISVMKHDYYVGDFSWKSFFNNDYKQLVEYITKNYIIILELCLLFKYNINISHLINTTNTKLAFDTKYKDCDINDAFKNTESQKLNRFFYIVVLYIKYFGRNDVSKLIKPSNMENCSSVVDTSIYKNIINVFKLLFTYGKSLNVNVIIELPDKNNRGYVIDNLNTKSKCSYFISREKLKDILLNKYNIKSKFEPSNFPGVIIKYLCKVNPHKVITIDIFHEGTIIILGSTSWNQVYDVHNFIKKVLTDNYKEIRSKTTIKSTYIDNNTISVFNIGKFYFVNKKTIICNNPRNFFKIKELDLLYKFI